MGDTKFSLDDKYTALEGQVALTGIQALVRLPMDQHRRDQDAGLRVGTYISGYQGSPLGELDKQIRMANQLTRTHDIVWQPGINEDVAATAIYGSQLLELFPHERFHGVNGIWYGKAPGVDRTGDAFRHGQFIGTSRYGAALALGGDDPACKSSTLPSDSTVAFYDLNFPIYYPGDPKEVLEMGLHALAMSRYSGLWTAMKIVTNVADGGAIVDVHPELGMPRIPELEIDGKPFHKSQDPRLVPPFTLETERQIYYERKLAALEYTRVNKLDKITVSSSADRLGLIAAGKSYKDLMQALHMLGFNEEDLRQAGIRVYKLGVIAPVEPRGLNEFAQGLETVLVVEEKRGFSETLIREILYNNNNAPKIYGKFDEEGRPFFPIHGEMGADDMARLLGPWLAQRLGRPDLVERVTWLRNIAERSYEPIMPRAPYFCSGCPHSTSTTVLEGDQVGGGIGCHVMATYMDRGVTFLTQMGGDGAPWMGLAPFTEKPHLFQNVGDGTYYHSASKSLEACIAAGVDMTYKLLYNSATSLTGGQPIMGMRSPENLATKLITEGVKQVVIVPEDTAQFSKSQGPGITVRPKSEYNQVMRELQKATGVTVILFVQQCAAEKRRQRKRGTLETPKQRVFINPSVCEGCGDCGVKANCLSVTPIETEYGRKTEIHQSSCNMDFSCLKGDCPAFMTVELAEGTVPAKRTGLAVEPPAGLPEPATKVTSAEPYRAMLIGIGGTGVVTADALLVIAAVMEGKYAAHLDQTGLAQKGGAVVSNLIISDNPVNAPNKIAAGEADLCLSFDLLATVSPDNLNRFHPDRTVAVANTFKIATAAVVTDVNARFPELAGMKERLGRYTRADRNIYLNSVEITEALFGDHMPNNLLLIGVAYQSGLLPLKSTSIEDAITANGVSVPQNIAAFRWGRQYVVDQSNVEDLVHGKVAGGESQDAAGVARAKLTRFAAAQIPALDRLAARFPADGKLNDLLYPRVVDLILYQNEAYATQYLDTVLNVAEAEHGKTAGRTALRESVARWLFKLMAIKDEYEVARLWIQDPLWEEVKTRYDGALTRFVHLHPPQLRAMGLTRKLKMGGWVVNLFGLLYRLKGIRGSALDPFNRSRHRKLERSLPGWYRGLIEGVLVDLTHENHAVGVAIANLPDRIRGFEEVKERNLTEARTEADQLLQTFHGRRDISSMAVGD